MKRLVQGLAVVALASGCATVQNAMNSATDRATDAVTSSASSHADAAADQAGSEAGDAVVNLGYGLQDCQKLRDDHVSLVEERSLGGALAVSAAMRMADVQNSPTPDKSPEDLRDFWKLKYPERAKLNLLNAAVAKVGARLAELSSRPDLPWSFTVLDDDSVNAFSTPGGYVMVSRGLLEQIHSENALAGALAHEIAHVTQRHAIQAYLQAKVDACRAAAGKSFLGSLSSAGARFAVNAVPIDISKARDTFKRWVGAPSAGLDFNLKENFDALGMITDRLTEALFDHPLTEEQELEADRLGEDLMVRAGYAPEPYIALVQSLPAGKPNSFLGHHPAPEKRVAELKKEEAVLQQDPLVDWTKLEKTGAVALAKDITSNLQRATATSDAP